MNGPSARIANRRLILQLCLFTAGSFAFGFALVPLYSVLCDITGYGNRSRLEQPSTIAAAPDRSRTVTVEFASASASFGDWEFHPEARSIEIHPGQLYEAKFLARNLRAQPVTAQAVPSISPGQATQYFHKTECFCFTPQSFDAHQVRELSVRFIVDPKLPGNIDRLTLAYAMYDLEGSG
jgi:cytochrome c oxidase assembly protein subunit 11